MSFLGDPQIWRMNSQDASHYQVAAVTPSELLIVQLPPDAAQRFYQAQQAGRAHEALETMISERKFKKIQRFDRPSITGFGVVAGAKKLCVENADRRYFVGQFDKADWVMPVADTIGPTLFPNGQVRTERLMGSSQGLRMRTLQPFGYSSFFTMLLGYGGLSGDHDDVYVRRGRWLVDLLDAIPDTLALAGAALSFALGVGLTARHLAAGYELQVVRPASEPLAAPPVPSAAATTTF